MSHSRGTRVGSDKADVLVIGAGAVGSALAAALCSAGSNVVIFHHTPERVQSIQKCGITLAGAFKVGPIHFKACRSDLASLISEFTPQIIILSTRMTGLANALQMLKETAPPKTTTLLFCQNGMGLNPETWAGFEQNPKFRIIVNYSCRLVDMKSVAIAPSTLPNQIGRMDDSPWGSARNIATSLSRVGLQTELIDNIDRNVLWKTIVNSAAAVCAAYDLTVGQVLTNLDTRQKLEGILKEGRKLSKILGIDVGKEFHREAMVFFERLAGSKPSIARDMEAGRRTEIESFNGSLLKLARNSGMNMPYTRLIYERVLAREQASSHR